MKKETETLENQGKKDNRGGARKGAGRPKKTEENQNNQKNNQKTEENQNQKVVVEYVSNYSAKYWGAVLYPENLREDWEEELVKIGLPFAYCTHNRTKVNGEDRKEHIHILTAFNNTTTYKNVLRMFKRLDKADNGNKTACNKVEGIFSMENAYNYLIHDTADCRAKGKELYDKSERKLVNNFDIGAYIQVSIEEQEQMIDELADALILNHFTNFIDFYAFVCREYENKEYKRLVRKNSGFFERLTKGNYQKAEASRRFCGE